MKILITGGAGYIGSVTNRYLQENGVDTVVFDNLSTGYKTAIGNSIFVQGDLKNAADVNGLFTSHSFDAVIHFAAKALAGESMEKPAEYFANNIIGGTNLLEAMRTGKCNKIIFSSTCAVYGFPDALPVTENESYKPVSVYGASKRMFEEVLEWYSKIFGISFVNLRYFNASGAALDGSLGEAHIPETHIIPKLFDAASGKADHFDLFGTDYNTSDGTCIRDYIHVLDLADAHIKAVKYLSTGGESTAINLGVGMGYSNREVISAVEKVVGKKVPIREASRRPGDPDAIYADNSKAKKILGWKPQYSSLETIITTAWEWYSKHPGGYEK